MDFATYYALFGDDADVTCPYCSTRLTITSEISQVGEESFQCSACNRVFVMDWDNGKIYYDD